MAGSSSDVKVALNVSSSAFRGLPQSYSRWLGGRILGFVESLRGLLAFALITLGVMISKRRKSTQVIHPLIWEQVIRSGVALLPILLFLSCALGLVIIGQTVTLTNRVGAQGYLGGVMVSVVVRELGPLLAALVVLIRTGTATVIELGTARSSREVEALEAIGIDPIHYLVVPRLLGMSLGVFCLTVYGILAALVSGYLWAFVQEIPILPGAYFSQLAAALHPLDFLALGIKSICLGLLIALVSCYHGLAHPLRVEDLPNAAMKALSQGVVLCVVVDALFLILYLIL